MVFDKDGEDMRILAVSDVHGNMEIYKKIVGVVKEKKIDVLVLPGDLYPKPSVVTLETFQAIQKSSASEISALFQELNIPIFYILGNDDWIDEGITTGIHLHGNIVEYQGFFFTGFEYINSTPFQTNREKSEHALKRMFQEQVLRLQLKDKKPLIVVGHAPLFEKRDKTFRGKRVGSRKLRMEIEQLQPLIYFCGHIHEDFGADKLNETYIFNCSCYPEINLLRGFFIEIKENQVTYEEIIR
jgi:uncharacterized protein